MISFLVEVDGVQKKFAFDPTKDRLESPMLAAIKARLENLEPAFDQVHDILLELQRSIFDTEGQAIGKPWPKYNQDERGYAGMKRAILGDAYPMLRWRGGQEILYPSLTEASHPDHIFDKRADSFTFGTSVPYAAGHHTGTGEGWRGKYIVPKRPLMGADWKHVGKVIQAIQAYVFGSTGPLKSRGGIFG
jgi:phage gpG-like protein